MDWLKDWWAHIAALVGLVFWTGHNHRKINELVDSVHDKENPIIRQKEFDQVRLACQSHNEAMFASGRREFEEIKIMIAANAKSSEDRHNCLVKMLMEMKR